MLKSQNQMIPLNCKKTVLTVRRTAFGSTLNHQPSQRRPVWFGNICASLIWSLDTHHKKTPLVHLSLKRGSRYSRMSAVCHQISSNIITWKIPDMAAAMAEIQQPLEIIIDGVEPLKSPVEHQIGGDSPWIRIMELDPYRRWTTCRGCRQNPDGCRDLLFFQVQVQLSVWFFF